MDDTDNLDDVFNDVVYDNNAQEVFKKLQDLDNQRDRLVSRWVWELMQNARGIAGSQQDLKIELVVEAHHLRFRHNGAFFKDREIAHLILHGSTKTDQRDIGKFGTGFITTHLLSRSVNVRGSLADGRTFDFVLNRGGSSAAILREAMKKSKEDFQNSLTQAHPPLQEPYTTEYSYPLVDSVREVVAKGIETLCASAPYIFAFNPMLRGLKITTPTKCVDLDQEELASPVPEMRSIAVRNAIDKSEQTILFTANKDITAAIALERDDQVRVPSGVPRLFVAFPLNNTETFCIPLVLNSEKFVPKEDRDGLYLGTSATEVNKKNQELFEMGCQEIVSMVTAAAANNWGNVAAATYLQAAAIPTWADENWLKVTIREVLIRGFRQNPLLLTISGARINPSKAWIPIAQKNASSSNLWTATQALTAAAIHLPRNDEQHVWEASMGSWRPFLSAANDPTDEIWTVTRLAKHIEGLKSLKGIAAALREGYAEIEWINSVHELICKADAFDTFRQRAVIPNECGHLSVIGKLQGDGGIHPELKDIADLMGVSVRETLVHPDVQSKEIVSSLSVRTEEQVLVQLIDLVRQRTLDQPESPEVLSANLRLFAWLNTNDKSGKLDGFHVLSASRGEAKAAIFILRGSSPGMERPLAPVSIWPETAKSFSELFPTSAIFHPGYGEVSLNREHWRILESKGFVHLSPLYENSSVVQDFLPDEPLSEEEPGVESTSPHQRTEIAFLGQVLERTRGSVTRALGLIGLLFDFILPSDGKAFDLGAADCGGGIEHRFYRAGWLKAMKTRTWVPIGDKKAGTPSPENLALLLAKDPALLKRTGEERISLFLTAIGVSPADLMLRSVGCDEPERISLIQSLADITAAVGNDAEKVKAFAGAVKDDPQLIVLAEERRNRKAAVKRNQALGDLVEQLFVEAFKDTGLATRRTGPGHDYQIEIPEGEEDDAAHFELKGPAGEVYVEIKATSTTEVRMSTKQVREAVANKARYFLCVLATSEPTPDVSTFKVNARFVPDIGEKLLRLHAQYILMETAVQGTQRTDGGLAIELVGHQAKFRIAQEVWENELRFDDAIKALKSLLIPPL